MAKFSEVLRARDPEQHCALEGYESGSLRLYGKDKKRLIKFCVKDSDLATVCGTLVQLTIQGDVFFDSGSFFDAGDSYERGVQGTAVRVIYNPPATIAFWADGSKTVVKCDKDDVYDPKYGLALCYMKKALGSSRAFNDALRAGREEDVRKFLKEHRYIEHLLDDKYKNVCPIVDAPCLACPYRNVRNLFRCAELMHEDIKKMREGEKHD